MLEACPAAEECPDIDGLAMDGLPAELRLPPEAEALPVGVAENCGAGRASAKPVFVT